MKQAIQMKENMYWVGVHDFNCRHFHGDLFPIAEGTTYNSYLIVDEQVTLIDTVEEEFYDTMMERIRSVSEPLTMLSYSMQSRIIPEAS